MARRRSSLGDECEQLQGLLSKEDWDSEEVNSLLKAMADSTRRASAVELAQAVATMSQVVRTASPQEAGIAALTVGTMIEYGGPPDELYQAIISRLRGVLSAAERVVAEVNSAFPAPIDDDKAPPPDAFWVGDVPVPYDWIRALARRDREAVGAFNTLQDWCMPLISVAIRHRRLLADLTARKELQAAVAPLATVHGSAGFLFTLMLVSLNEALLFVHVPSTRAFALAIDGVPYNFDLHTLLAAALADALGHMPPPLEVVQCIRGAGSESCAQYSAGRWNLYTWKAARQPWDKLDKAPLEHWIWNEGRPADIPHFDGTRLILATEEKIHRTWNTQRTFSALPANVTLERELPREEAAALMRRVHEAARRK